MLLASTSCGFAKTAVKYSATAMLRAHMCKPFQVVEYPGDQTKDTDYHHIVILLGNMWN